MDSVLSVLEIIGVVAFALSGAMIAIKSEMDIFGVCVLGVTTAVGGGIIRDLLLGIAPPSMLLNPLAALIAVCVSVFVFLPFVQRFFHSGKHKLYDRLVLIADSIGLGVFTVMGVNICYSSYETPTLFMSVFLGVITGVGGGVLRDVMSKNKPYIFVKHFYACASIAGALACAILRTYVNELIATVAGMLLVVSLRLLAATLHWKLPKSKYSSEEKQSKEQETSNKTHSTVA